MITAGSATICTMASWIASGRRGWSAGIGPVPSLRSRAKASGKATPPWNRVAKAVTRTGRKNDSTATMLRDRVGDQPRRSPRGES